MRYFIAIIALVFLDQQVKNAINVSFELFESVPFLGDLVSLTYIRNTGAAFSILQDQRLFLMLFPLIMSVALVIVLIRQLKTWKPLPLWGISFIVAGGIGNLLDRALRGYVVDYIDFHFFPIFNIADICVCVGCGLLLLYFIFFDRPAERDG